MIVLDTNLLIYAHREETQEHGLAKKAIEEAFTSQSTAITVFSLAEFWSIVTHPLAKRRVSTPKEAQSFIDALLQDGPLQVLKPGLNFEKKLMQPAQELNIQGVRIFDLQIAVLALEHGAKQLWTHDKNFIKLPGLKVHDPIG